MRVAGDTVDPITCVALAMAMLTLQPTSAPQQCCCVGISHGGMSAVPMELTAIPTTDAEPEAVPIGIACPDIGTPASVSAELAMAE